VISIDNPDAESPLTVSPSSTIGEAVKANLISWPIRIRRTFEPSL
jgi:hypothetical protein